MPFDFPVSESPQHAAQASRMPLAALLAFAMTGFIAILTETLPAGLLPQIAAGLGVSQASAGQLVTAYALGSLLAALPLTLATQSWRRRPVLLTAVLGFLIFNTLTTVATSFVLILVARFMAGVAAGLSWGLLAGYAHRLVPAHRQGKALAIAMVGTPIALSLGTPAGIFLGVLLGWRVAFGIMSALTLVLIPWILWAVPDKPGQSSRQRLGLLDVLRQPGIRPVLLVILIWMLGHNVLYTYVAPYLAAHAMASAVGGMLLVFGVAALLGIAAIGMTVDRWLRPLSLLSLAGFLLAAIMLAKAAHSAPLIYTGIALWGLCFGGAATLLQTAAADAAGPHVDALQAMVTTTWNMAIAAGGIGGGLLLPLGAAVTAWAMALLSLLGLTLVLVSPHGFRPGRRTMAEDH